MGALKIYIQPTEMVYNAMLDLMELQKGKEVLNDPVSGKLYFSMTMYSLTWEVRFTVLNIDWKRCGIRLEIEEVGDFGEEREYLRGMLCREYAMLDAMLLIGTPIEVTYSGGE